MEIKCEECEGNGVTSVFRGCSQLPSNCCGGCEVNESCLECNGSGLKEIDPYKYVEKQREDLHEEISETIDKMVDFFGANIVEEYLLEISEKL